MHHLLLLLSLLLTAHLSGQQRATPPVRVGVAGLTHGHVGWILGREDRGDIELVGIAEADRALVRRSAERFGFDTSIVYPTLEAMLEATRPEAVTAFNSIRGHLAVVEACAPRGVHVMVEKPLAFRRADARRMASLASEHGIHLLTNYETTWYPANHAAFRLADGDSLGTLRKMVIRDGHPGPVEIGVGPAFLHWLTDPEENGGGALIDFGCYGANIATRLMQNRHPLTVTAITQQLKPEVYPEVDDEATIVLTYPGAQAIVQASWNWPIGRKDMDLYGAEGYVRVPRSTGLLVRLPGTGEEATREVAELPHGIGDPFAYLAAVVRGQIDPDRLDLSGLANNLVVVDILDAARRSARLGRSVDMDAFRSGSTPEDE